MAAPPRQVALVLAGGVLKGAFEAGALEVLAARGIGVRRIVAASSGALNGAAYAAGVRARRDAGAARDLVQVWLDEASLRGAIHPSLGAILRLQGFSDQTKLLELLRRHVRPSAVADPAPIELHVVVAPLRGVEGAIDGEPATTYSQVIGFSGDAFDDTAGLERLFVAVTASAALPVLYAPVDVPGLGPCTDGGLVNNTPIGIAFGPNHGDELDAIVVLTPTPSLFNTPSATPRGLGLVAHQIDMVFAEWLYRDLRRAMRVNDGLARLDALAARHGWSAADVDEIKRALGYAGARNLPIVTIRPRARLPGTLLSGFTDRGIRRAYVEIGRARATEVLDDLGW